MKRFTPLTVSCLFLLSIVVVALTQKTHNPPVQSKQAQAGPQLLFPDDYRQWIYLSSGLNMEYKDDKPSSCKEGDCQMFENAFVRPEAYKTFLQEKVWPVGTVFMVERRCAVQKASIDTKGTTQSRLTLIAASQKTAENGWNYYVFSKSKEPLTCIGPDPSFATERADPVSNSADPKLCWNCHKQNGLKDNTFIQFYPTLKPLIAAKSK